MQNVEMDTALRRRSRRHRNRKVAQQRNVPSRSRTPILLAQEMLRRHDDLNEIEVLHSKLKNSALAPGSALAETFSANPRSTASEIRQRYRTSVCDVQHSNTITDPDRRLPSVNEVLQYLKETNPESSNSKLHYTQQADTFQKGPEVLKRHASKRRYPGRGTGNVSSGTVILSAITPELKSKIKRIPRPNAAGKERLAKIGRQFMDLVADPETTELEMAGSLYDKLATGIFKMETSQNTQTLIEGNKLGKESTSPNRSVVAPGMSHLAGLQLTKVGQLRQQAKQKQKRQSVTAVPKIQVSKTSPTSRRTKTKRMDVMMRRSILTKQSETNTKQVVEIRRRIQVAGGYSELNEQTIPNMSNVGLYEYQLQVMQDKKLMREVQISELMASSRKYVPRDIILSQGIQRFVKRSGLLRLQYVVARMAFRHTGEAFELWKKLCRNSRSILENKSAMCIQRAWTIYLCACEVRERRNILYQQIANVDSATRAAIEARNAAAVVMQCCARVHQARSIHHALIQRLEGILTVQRGWRASKSRFVLTMLKAQQQQRIAASIKIQKVFRGHRGREWVKLLRKIEYVDRKTKQVAEQRELVQVEFRKLGAVSKIQQWWRGQQRRSYTRAMVMVRKRRKILKLQSWWRMILGKKELARRKDEKEKLHQRTIEAARLVQRVYRGHRGKRAVQGILAERERQRLARVDLKSTLLKDKIVTIKSRFIGEKQVNVTKTKKMLFNARQILDPRNKKRRKQAATKIQAVFRGFRARRRVRTTKRAEHLKQRAKRKIDTVEAAILLQRQFRGLVERRRVRKVVQAKTAVRLQAIYRGKKARKVVFAAAERHYAASKIQACWRACVRRPIYEIVRNRRQVQTKMSQHIQRFHRGFYTRLHTVPTKLEIERYKAEVEQMGAKGFARAVAKYTDHNMVQTAFHAQELERDNAGDKLQGKSKGGKLRRRKQREALETGGCQLVYKHWGHAKNGLSSDRFAKFVKLTPGLISQRNLDSTAVDILFVRVKKDSKLKTITVSQFVQALCELSSIKLRIAEDAEKRENFRYRGYVGNPALLLHIFTHYIWNAPWAEPVLADAQRATLVNMNQSATRIQSALRGAMGRWRFQRLVVESEQFKEDAKVARCATRIQGLWRKRKARKLLDVQAAAVIERYVISETGEVYWFNKLTQETQWETPSFLADFDRMSVKPRTIILPDVKEEYIVQCSVCVDVVAQFTCDQCLDPFCEQCFRATHKRGNKAGHTITEIRHCNECSYQAATRVCLACPTSKSLYCCTCYVNEHQEGSDLEGHKWKPIVVPCSECEVRGAKIQCRGCDDDVYCIKCFETWHSRGRRASHSFRLVPYMTEVVYSKYELQRVKEQVDKEQRRLQEIEDQRNHDKLEWAATKLQAAFRSRKIRFYGKRFLKKKRKKLRVWYQQSKVDDAKKQTLGYIVKDMIGQAPVLTTDSDEARARKAKGWKGTKWGNTMVKAAELASLPEGKLLPGTATVWRNYYGIGTTADLTNYLEEGVWIRIGMQAFQVTPTAKVPLTSKLVPIDFMYIMSESVATMNELEMYLLPPLTVAQVGYVTSKRAIASSSAFRSVHGKTDQGRKHIHFKLTGLGESLGGKSNMLGRSFLKAASVLGKASNLDTVQIIRSAKSPWITHKDHVTGKEWYVNPITGVTTHVKPDELKTKIQLREEEKQKHDAENNLNSTTVKHANAKKRMMSKKTKIGQSKARVVSPFAKIAEDGLTGTSPPQPDSIEIENDSSLTKLPEI